MIFWQQNGQNSEAWTELGTWNWACGVDCGLLWLSTELCMGVCGVYCRIRCVEAHGERHSCSRREEPTCMEMGVHTSLKLVLENKYLLSDSEYIYANLTKCFYLEVAVNTYESHAGTGYN